ncbi:hypothetical protein CPB83DRAFT_895541 [Crepidotus variabilis]|uniref:Uncharacterized protein n=1 Tax=Crepidotus variabilis TaxID=179855 RepID=A0A9P6ECW2_9AGAR|nr:hypothetical protein CPB83DRAFT_895541 [Crepidotus variabilis]
MASTLGTLSSEYYQYLEIFPGSNSTFPGTYVNYMQAKAKFRPSGLLDSAALVINFRFHRWKWSETPSSMSDKLRHTHSSTELPELAELPSTEPTFSGIFLGSGLLCTNPGLAFLNGVYAVCSNLLPSRHLSPPTRDLVTYCYLILPHINWTDSHSVILELLPSLDDTAPCLASAFFYSAFSRTYVR